MYCPHFHLDNRQCDGICDACPYGYKPFPNTVQLKINEEKIAKQIEKIQNKLKKDNHRLTLKGIVSIVINLIGEQQ